MIIANSLSQAENRFIQASNLPDISGISWIRGDLFLAVHDAKSNETGPRISFLKLPSGSEGILWKPATIKFPNNESNDFESIARIPSSENFLLAESTEQLKEKPYSCRVFLAEIRGEMLEIMDETKWSFLTKNIEGTAVAQVDGKFYFLFAERGHGEPDSEINMSELHFNPLRIGNPRNMGRFKSPYPIGKNARPVSAMEIDQDGWIYVSSCEDPDDDNGPFSSALYRIGQIVRVNSNAKVILAEKPVRLAILDGVKVEAIAVRELPGKPLELFVGLDDENYGGTVRPIRLKQP